jgi:NAD(P)-dependent dehydrogenase (short-subunit alcohol dehydrogenase family)
MGVSRRYVIKGTASGIGQATKRLLEAKGARVIGVDIRDADVIADLTTEAGRLALVDQVRSLLGNSHPREYELPNRNAGLRDRGLAAR